MSDVGDFAPLPLTAGILRKLLSEEELRRLVAELSELQELLPPKAAKEYLKRRWGIERSVRTLQQLRRDGGGPKFRRAGNDVVYTPLALDEWVRERFGNEFRSTAEESGRRLLRSAERDD